MRARAKTWAGVAAALVCAQAAMSFFLPRSFTLTLFCDLAQGGLLLAAVVFFWPQIRKSSGRDRLFWMLMATGVGLWFTYQLVWTCFEVVLRREVPDPFLGDVLLFLHLVPMMAALALQPHRQADERTIRVGWLDFVLLVIWWIYLYLFAVIPWQYVHFNPTLSGRSYDALYITEKIMYLGCLAVVFFRSTGAWKTLYLQWLGASLLYTVSSVLANVAIRNGTYYTGSLYDVPLTVAMAWYAGIALVAPTLPLKKQPSPAGHHQGVWAARLAMLAILSMPILAGVTMAMDLPVSVHTYRLRLTLGTILLMGSLVFLKQHLLDRELLRLLRSTQDNLEDVKRLQSQLVQSEKLASLGQLVGGAAHELNNPLTAVLGYAEILASTNPLTPDQRSLTDKIVQQVHRTKALVSSLLSFAKQVPGERTLLDLNSVARTALTQTKPHLRTRNIDVRTSLAVDLPLVLGDQNQLLQVCLHIINNALQALEEVGGGTLQIATGWDDGFASLEFSDNGPGAREPEKVFDPFYTTKGVGKGSGLGLSACYGIIQDHQGRILCRNRPEGGATFRIELPHSGSAKQAVLALADSKPKAGEEADRDVASATLSLPPAPR